MSFQSGVGALLGRSRCAAGQISQFKVLMLVTSALLWGAIGQPAAAESAAAGTAEIETSAARSTTAPVQTMLRGGREQADLWAQSLGQADAQQNYAIPAGPLAPALNRFADESGLQLIYGAEIAANTRTDGLQGRYTPEQALRILLAGSGIAYSFADSGTVTLMSASAQTENGPTELGPVTVEAEVESPFGPVKGYVANRSATGSKTDTPLIEIPQSISVITRDQLDDQGADSLSEALRYTPGVFGEAFGNDSRVDFLQYRGFSEDGAGVFQDGLQLRSTGFAEFMPELYGAQRVDILRGPASVLYGQGSPGGLVNVQTKRPPAEFFAEAGVSGGSFEKIEGRFDVGGPVLQSESAFFRLTGLFRDSETQVDFVDDDRQFIAPAFTWKPQRNTSLTFLGYYQNDETGSTNQFLPAAGTVNSNPNGTISTSLFTGEPDFDRFDRTVFSLGYLFEHEFSNGIEVRQNARYSDLESDTETFFGVGFVGDQRTLARLPFIVDSSAEIFVIDNQAQFNFRGGPVEQTLLVGFDYQRYDFDESQGVGSQASGTASVIDVFDPDYGTPLDASAIPITQDARVVQDQFGIYLQDQFKIYEDLIVTLGGRLDIVASDRKDRRAGTKSDQDDSAFSGRAGIVYLTDIGLAPYASYSESFLPLIGFDSAGEAFEPETGQQFEIGLKYQPDGSDSSITVAAFDITRENVRTADPVNSLLQVQTGEVRSRGIEVEGIASFDFGLDLIAGYTFQDVEITESNVAGEEGSRPAGVPEHQASLWSFYTLQDGLFSGLGFGAGVRYKGSTQGNSTNTFTVDEYVLFDAAARYQWKNLSFSLNATNLFDNQHVASCTGDFACFYGSDRAVTAGLQFRW